MPNIATLTYGTLLAYVMPACIVALAFLPFYYDWLKCQWRPDLAGFFVLVFIGVSILVGFLINALATVVTALPRLQWSWLQRKKIKWIVNLFKLQEIYRNIILFGKPHKGEPSVLFKEMEILYPFEKLETLYPEKIKNRQDKGDKIKVQIDVYAEYVYAIFNTHVREHVYARRNWDWYFYQASRNMLMASLLSIFAPILTGFRPTWSWTCIVVGLVLTIIIIALCLLALRQLEIYYGFYANVVLGHLLKQGQQVHVNDPTIAETGKV